MIESLTRVLPFLAPLRVRGSNSGEMQRPTLVLIESPYAGDIEANLAYLHAAMRDCLFRGEAPFASHALYTLSGVLDDTIPEEREVGIQAGLAWGLAAARTVVYTDRGISRGMQQGIDDAKRVGRPVEFRSLPSAVREVA